MACLKTSCAVFLATLALSTALKTALVDRTRALSSDLSSELAAHEDAFAQGKPLSSELAANADTDAQDKPKKNKQKKGKIAKNKGKSEEEKQTDTEAEDEEQAMNKRHSDAVSGLHIARAWYMNENFGNASFTVSNQTQCQGSRDSLGDTACHFHFGDAVKLQASWKRSDIEEGTTLEFDFELKTTGMMAAIQVEPIKIKCPLCGGTCEFDIFRGNGVQLVPTQADLIKIPIIGQGLTQAATMYGMPLPKDREDLSKQINALLAMATMLQPGLFDTSAFKTDDQKFVFGENTIKFPMPACPLKQLAIPALSSPPMAGLSVSINSDSLGLSANIPDMDAFDMAEGVVNFGVKVVDKKGERLTAFAGSMGVNSLPKEMALLKADIAKVEKAI